jgi:TolB-like protein/DNA-binding winged helix-turn-helix (wHTH) protein/tetratricopeptide (TPR) repeat protein
MNTEKISLFEDFTLDLARGCLLRGSQPIHLRPQSYEVLKYLVANKGRLISKDQLIEDVWQGRAVTDGSLGKCIEELRAVLGKDARQYVRNVRGRGYIFDPKTDEQSPLESESRWSEEIDVVRVLVEDEYHENDAAQARRAVVTPSPSGVSSDSRRTLSRTKGLVLAITVLLVVTAGMAAYYYSWIAPKTTGLSKVKSLAVLPFKSLSGEAGNEYLGLGMADTVITRLSNLREVAVRPTSAVMKYDDSAKERIEICRELGVDAVLEGSIHISGGRMRVTVQLVSVRAQTPIWADTFDERFTDIFSVEDSISQRVAERLTLELSSDDRKALTKHQTENTEAHLLGLSGRYLLEKKKTEGTRKAIEYFEKAIEKDPKYALAYAGIAESYFSLSITGSMEPREAFPKARAAATKALEIDPLLADAHYDLGIAHFFHDWDWAAAEREFKRAIEINPNYAAPHEMYAHLLSNLGRHDEALVESSRSLELNPLSLISNAIRGQILFFAGRYDEAAAHLQNAINIEPNFWISHLTLGKVYERKKMYSQALAEFQSASQVSGGAPEPKSLLAYTLAVSGNPGEARRLVNELQRMSQRQYVAPKHIALVYAGLREKDEMLDWLEKAYRDRDISLTFIKVEPRWDEYRAEPRFADLLRRVGFTQ